MWVGWYRTREGEPWRRACQAPTLAECSRRLTEATRGMHLRNLDLFLTTGHVPRTDSPTASARQPGGNAP